MPHQTIILAMHQFIPRLAFRMSSTRVFSTLQEFTSDTWTVEASIPPPDFEEDNGSLKVKFGSSLMFSFVETAKRYTKGRQSYYHPLSFQDALRFAFWLPQNGPLRVVTQQRQFVVESKKQTGNVKLTFRDRKMPESIEWRHLSCGISPIVSLQQTLKHGLQDFTGMRGTYQWHSNDQMKVMRSIRSRNT